MISPLKLVKETLTPLTADELAHPWGGGDTLEPNPQPNQIVPTEISKSVPYCDSVRVCGAPLNSPLGAGK